MRKIFCIGLLATCFIAVGICGFGIIASTQTTGHAFQISGECKKVQCSICGKELEEWHENSLYSEDSMFYVPISGCWNPAPAIKSLDFDLILCSDCYAKYYPEIKKQMEDLLNEWLKQKQAENTDLRKANIEEIKNKKLKNIDEEIQWLQRQREEITNRKEDAE